MGQLARLASACAAAALLAMALPAAGASAADDIPRVDLRVLVVDDGEPATTAIRAELTGAGTPFTTVSLADSGRARIDEAFLSDTVDGRPRAKYQGVVLPNDNPFGTDSKEMAALTAYEKRFGIRQVDAYTYARPAVGLNLAQDSGYIGPLDGRTAQVTAAGAAGPFKYLSGNVPFEDNNPSVNESYGYAAVPLAKQQDGATFTSYLDTAIAGSSARGSLIGQYTHDGRSELVVTFVYNEYQSQQRLVSRGVVEWLTQGIHLGASHNYFSIHVDDLFAADDRWDSDLNCTPGDVDCPGGTEPDTAPIRMTTDDAEHAKEWSRQSGVKIDFAYNGGGSIEYRAEHGGKDPLADKFVADQGSYRWINHTLTHAWLGCVQDLSVVPWKCQTDAAGKPKWTSRAEITSQIQDNLDWAKKEGLTLDPDELVTGEHSGLSTTPQQPADNPELAPALASAGVTWLGSDTSREKGQRQAGPALTVPRYPMNVFYNAGKAAEEVDEYNWIYGKKADGGSGTCENSTNTTCLPAPLDIKTGYTSYIVPLETRIALGHVLGNDPRPHFMHQSNLSEERIGYQVLDKILGDYKALFADNTPLINPRMRDAGAELRERADWQRAVTAGQVTAYRIGSAVTVQAPAGVKAPVTAPDGTVQNSGGSQAPFGAAYAGARSGWAVPAAGQSGIALDIPAALTPHPAAHAGPAAHVQRPAAGLPVPAGVRHPVSYGPGDANRR
ncbi:hypothetical protein AB0I22_16345 [Streptomyces sp. NPDC050610]|uniref:hypothetical protein n=1 Tax=Streptomyces sp. NPDC050610 TaxID=3157097 RepID=UPI00341FFA8D